RVFLVVFSTVFLAELGDKTQLATVLFAAERTASKWLVFSGAALALVATSALGVLVGEGLGHLLHPKWLHTIAGVGFVVIGVLTMIKA
ncbi:MAG: TMEM165/GDT1 family protein, partial [Gloeomargarita sp. GMQP_bins_14]